MLIMNKLRHRRQAGVAVGLALLLPVALAAVHIDTVQVRRLDTAGHALRDGAAAALSAVAHSELLSQSMISGVPVAPFAPLTASGGSSTYRYTVTPALPSGLSLNAANGMISGTPRATATGLYTVSVADAATHGVASVTAPLDLTVHPAVTALTPTSANSVIAGDRMTFSAFRSVGGGGSGRYTYSIVSGDTTPSWITIGKGDGLVTVSPPLSEPMGRYTAIFQVADEQNAKAAVQKRISIAILPPVTTVVTVDSYSVPAAGLLSFNPFAQVKGGSGKYNYSVDGNKDWLSVDSRGRATIRQAPQSDVGKYTVTFKVSDNLASKIARSVAIEITITDALTATLQREKLAQLTAGVSVAAPFAPVVAAGGTPAYRFALARDSARLPAGLMLNSSTGMISGKTKLASSVNLIVNVTDHEKPPRTVAATPFTLTVTASGAPTVDHVTLTGVGKVGEPLTAAYHYGSTGADKSTYRWLRDGQPIDNAHALSYTVADADMGSQIQFEVTPVSESGVKGAPAYSASTARITRHVSLRSTSVARPAYSVLHDTTLTPLRPFEAAGGVMPYTYKMVNGSGMTGWPTTLRIDAASGTLSGTVGAMSLGTQHLYVSVTDANGETVSDYFNFSVFATGYVLDVKNGKIYRKEDGTRQLNRDYYQAENYCAYSNFGGYGGWQLPSPNDFRNIASNSDLRTYTADGTSIATTLAQQGWADGAYWGRKDINLGFFYDNLPEGEVAYSSFFYEGRAALVMCVHDISVP